MRWRLAAAVPLAFFALGFGAHGAFPAPLMNPALGAGAESFQRADAQRPSNHPLKHCLARNGAPSCHSAAATPLNNPDNANHAKSAQAPQLPEVPGSTSSSATTDTLPLPSNPPPGAAGRSRGNRQVGTGAGEPQTGSPSPVFNFTGGMGVPTNRSTLEGTLSPYQQPNGNTSASQSGKLTNGLETQGMHFGFEFRY